jgi:hypothetical protein
MLVNPERFDAMVGNNICICFTATPDDKKMGGVEQRVIAALDFRRFELL